MSNLGLEIKMFVLFYLLQGGFCVDYSPLTPFWPTPTFPDPNMDYNQNGLIDILDFVEHSNITGFCGTTYYVSDCGPNADPDCVIGNDSQDGLSPDTPWQTYERARGQFASLQAGDRIVFARGGSFVIGGSSNWVNNNATPTQPVVVGSYLPPWASGDEGSPIILQTSDNNAFGLDNPGNAVRQSGYLFEDLDLRCTGCSNSGRAFFLFNDIDHVTVQNVDMDGFAIGVEIAGSNPCSADPNCDGVSNDFALLNSRVTNNIHQGLLGGGARTRVENNYFATNGSTPTFDHNLYLVNTTDARVVGNTLYQSALDPSGNCSATSMVFHGFHHNLLIENNLVYEDINRANQGCWGISLSPAYTESELFSQVVIRGNQVINVGNQAIGVASCQDCLIENNVVIQENGFGINGIVAPGNQRGPEDAPMDQITIRNNSIFIANGGGRGIALNDEGSQHRVVSNAIHYVSSGSFSCFDLNLAPAQYSSVDFNNCFFSGTGEWEFGSGTSPDPLSAWQILSGWDTNSSFQNPLFQAPAGPSFNCLPMIGSPLIDQGDTVNSSASDILGNLRDANPDIGAFERQN